MPFLPQDGDGFFICEDQEEFLTSKILEKYKFKTNSYGSFIRQLNNCKYSPCQYWFSFFSRQIKPCAELFRDFNSPVLAGISSRLRRIFPVSPFRLIFSRFLKLFLAKERYVFFVQPVFFGTILCRFSVVSQLFLPFWHPSREPAIILGAVIH